ncbi:MAG: long-chain fatty acid--CoA ligase [Acidobacteria bacterium]|nr:long-chain fatty acid--CoA ligase [Acidobacteriota bacterium]MBV9476093.1 long-chain fatty acid--CoA ligase [Acidobacteriota bacterium]
MQEPKTLNDIYAVTCSIDRPAIMKSKRGGKWVDVSVPEFRDTVRWLSSALHELGVKPGDRVGILSENRPEWTIADFAILTAGGVSVPVYPTLLGWQIEYILNDAGTVAVICSNQEQLDKVLEIRPHVPCLHTIIVCDPPANLPAGVKTYHDVVEAGRRWEAAHGPNWFEQSRTRATPGDLATLVYTSGTTGNPKGAMLTHGNITSNVVTVRDIVPFRTGDTALSILPLSHILERMTDFLFFYKGGTIAYAENVNKVADNLAEVRPQYFAAVPRLFEKMRSRILDNVATAPAVRQKIFRWALGVAEERLPMMVEKKPLTGMLKIKSAIADKLVFSKIVERLGGNVKYVVSGGAPLSADLAAFFIGAGVEILEGYGLTETSPVIAVNRPDKRRIGSVGPIIPGIEVKIAEDGEILTRGPHVMKGYWNNPDATAQAIDAQGWFHTGDIGEIDRDGFLKITDRKKDIIINAYGKNIAPQPLEALLKSSPYVGTPVLIGDRRKFLTALIVPNFEKLERDAASLGVSVHSREELVNNERIRALIQDEIDRFNQNLDRQEKIRRFALLPRDFTIEEDEITPSLKVKRKVIDKKYKQVIDSLYADENLVEASA